LRLKGWVVALVVDTACDDTGNESVGGNAGCERAQEGSNLDEGHLGG